MQAWALIAVIAIIQEEIQAWISSSFTTEFQHGLECKLELQAQLKFGFFSSKKKKGARRKRIHMSMKLL
jgi:hypothetical protein